MKFNGKNFEQVIEAHQRWLHGCLDEPLVEEYSSRADFSSCRLEGRDFHGMNLDKANFKDADLHNCDFSNASLSMAEFNGAELYRCDFGFARLNSSTFIGAKIFDCNFFGANLCSVEFIDANIPMVCPEEGEFIAWKVALASTEDLVDGVRHTPVLVKLLIPADAKRSSGFGRKCRASKAKVLEICNLDGREINWKFCYRIHSCWHWWFEYEVGKIVEPEEAFNENRWIECASGIHFFLNRQEAIEYSKRL